MKNIMDENTKQELAKSYYDFISNIYRYDDENFVHYDKVEGLTDAMFQIYDEGSVKMKHFFLMGCIVDEINKVLNNLENK